MNNRGHFIPGGHWSDPQFPFTTQNVAGANEQPTYQIQGQTQAPTYATYTTNPGGTLNDNWTMNPVGLNYYQFNQVGYQTQPQRQVLTLDAQNFVFPVLSSQTQLPPLRPTAQVQAFTSNNSELRSVDVFSSGNNGSTTIMYGNGGGSMVGVGPGLTVGGNNGYTGRVAYSPQSVSPFSGSSSSQSPNPVNSSRTTPSPISPSSRGQNYRVAPSPQLNHSSPSPLPNHFYNPQPAHMSSNSISSYPSPSLNLSTGVIYQTIQGQANVPLQKAPSHVQQQHHNRPLSPVAAAIIAPTTHHRSPSPIKVAASAAPPPLTTTKTKKPRAPRKKKETAKLVDPLAELTSLTLTTTAAAATTISTSPSSRPHPLSMPDLSNPSTWKPSFPVPASSSSQPRHSNSRQFIPSTSSYSTMSQGPLNSTHVPPASQPQSYQYNGSRSTTTESPMSLPISAYSRNSSPGIHLQPQTQPPRPTPTYKTMMMTGGPPHVRPVAPAITTTPTSSQTIISPGVTLSVLDVALQKAGIDSSSDAGAQIEKKYQPTGDFDLESELNRFYNPTPPSPKKEAKAVAAAAAVSSASTPTSSINTNTSTTSCKVQVIVTNNSISSQSAAGAGKTVTTTAPTPTTRPSSRASPRARKTADSDDECEIVMIKLTRNRKRAAAAAGKKVPLQSRPNLTLTVDKDINKGEAPRAAAAAASKTKAVSRSAYPNGRFVSVAPKTQVPIPSRKSSPSPPPLSTTTPANRPKRKLPPVSYFDEVEPKLTRQAAKAALQAKGKDAPPSASSIQPPIRMKLSVKAGIVTATPSPPPPHAPKKTKAGPKSKTKTAAAAVTLPVKLEPLPVKDDDLEIVEEFLASDEDYDPEGERDEASSESDEDAHLHLVKRRVCHKLPDGVTKTPATHPPSLKEEKLPSEGDDGGTPHLDSPPTQWDCEDEPSSPPPSPPFKNIVEPPAPPPPTITSHTGLVRNASSAPSKEDNDSSSSDEEEVVFEMPRPSVVLKGTKEEAVEAVSRMRAALAQLTKFKLPFGR